MPRSCTICARPDAGSLNQLLGEGRSVRSLALEFTVSEDALKRHARNHAGRRRDPANPRTAPEASGDPLDELVVALRVRALAGDSAAAREYRLALAAQTAARHAAAPIRDLASDPEWIGLRAVMLAAVEPFGEARIAIADAILAAGLD